MFRKLNCVIILVCFTLLGGFILSGCDEIPSMPVYDSNVDIDLQTPVIEPEVIELIRNEGVTSANIRIYYVDDGIRWQHQPEFIFDLNRVEQYNEFVIREDGARIVIMSESVINNFKYLRIRPNDNFFAENAAENERRYNVESVLYTLDELTPEIPLVVTGIVWGGTLAAEGFSFVDENGTTRYFWFTQSGSDEEVFSYGEF